LPASPFSYNNPQEMPAMTKVRIPVLSAWSPKNIINLLKVKPGAETDWEENRKKILGWVDGFGLTAPESATLHALGNTEAMKSLLEQLVTPRPGERENLEKILALLQTIAKLNNQIVKGQTDLDERLAGLELQIAGMRASLMNQSSKQDLTEL
jgi:hypothetical protein